MNPSTVDYSPEEVEQEINVDMMETETGTTNPHTTISHPSEGWTYVTDSIGGYYRSPRNAALEESHEEWIIRLRYERALLPIPDIDEPYVSTLAVIKSYVQKRIHVLSEISRALDEFEETQFQSAIRRRDRWNTFEFHTAMEDMLGVRSSVEADQYIRSLRVSFNELCQDLVPAYIQRARMFFGDSMEDNNKVHVLFSAAVDQNFRESTKMNDELESRGAQELSYDLMAIESEIQYITTETKCERVDFKQLTRAFATSRDEDELLGALSNLFLSD